MKDSQRFKLTVPKRTSETKLVQNKKLQLLYNDQLSVTHVEIKISKRLINSCFCRKPKGRKERNCNISNLEGRRKQMEATPFGHNNEHLGCRRCLFLFCFVNRNKSPSAYQRPIDQPNTAHTRKKKNSNHPKKIHKTNISEIIEKDLIEDPEGVIIGSAKELVEGSRVVNVDLSVVNEVFAHIFSIIRPRVHRQTPY